MLDNIRRTSANVLIPRFKVHVPEVVIIPAGKFIMGNPSSQLARETIISRDFAIGKFEVTNEEWESFCLATNRKLSDLVKEPKMARHPGVRISWHDASAYTEWLKIETNGEKFRLLFEAEGEYAARGTDGRKYPWGNNWDTSRVASYTKGVTGTSPVDAHLGGVSPFGVWDLSGNVWEWRADWFTQNYLPKGSMVDPKGPATGTTKVVRGGSFVDSNENDFFNTCRLNAHPDHRDGIVGFRIAMDLE